MNFVTLLLLFPDDTYFYIQVAHQNHFDKRLFHPQDIQHKSLILKFFFQNKNQCNLFV